MRKTKLPQPLEREVQRSAIASLALMGVVLYRRNVALQVATYKGKSRVIRSGKVGQSDTYGWEITTGRHWEIELKRHGEKPTPAQLTWLQECGRTGAVAFWGDNVDTIERVAEAILAGGRIVWRNDGFFDVYVG